MRGLMRWMTLLKSTMNEPCHPRKEKNTLDTVDIIVHKFTFYLFQ